jgi:hypothetical protein
LETSKENHFQRESILDVVRLLVLYQTNEQITQLFDKWVYPLCETVLEDPKKFKKAKKEKKKSAAMEEDAAEDEKDVKKNELR